jgi:triosephosphate isomerase
MHGSLETSIALADGVRRGARQLDARACEVALFPAFPYLAAVTETLRDSGIAIGAQNMHWETSGAFTGETSPAMLRDLGCGYVILGHSERRQLFSESDGLIRKKVEAAIAAGLRPILCVGETETEREDGLTGAVLEAQLRGALEGLGATSDTLDIAYEPVWAIGTGRNATPDLIEEAHALIGRLGDSLLAVGSNELRILYGGSVKPANASETLATPGVGGVLVGGASLDADGFVAIAAAALRPGG